MCLGGSAAHSQTHGKLEDSAAWGTPGEPQAPKGSGYGAIRALGTLVSTLAPTRVVLEKFLDPSLRLGSGQNQGRAKRALASQAPMQRIGGRGGNKYFV